MKRIKIAVIDNEILFRKGIASVVAGEDVVDLCLEAENEEVFFKELENIPMIPDIVLVNLKIPNLDVTEFLKNVHRLYPQQKIIAFTDTYSDVFRLEVLSKGAVACVAKSVQPDKLMHVLKKVYHKGFYYDEHVLEAIHKKMLSPYATHTERHKKLTRRELEILQLICEQHTTVEIAEKLYISPRTVEAHRNVLLEKTATKNMAGLVVYAMQHKLVKIVPLSP